MTSQSIKLAEINKRITAIKIEITHYDKSIKHLKEVATYQRKLDSTPYAPRIIKYSCIPRSEKRFQWTLNNITVQMKLLEVELNALIKYIE